MARPNPLRLIGLILCLALLAGGVSAATTGVHVVKLANDGKTVLAEKTVDYRWLEANLPVKGDGSTHYYLQGPVSEGDKWDPTDSKNVEDMGAVKGTALRDLCGLVGGMQSGDSLVVQASDGMKKRFSYGTVYSPAARQGQIVLTWYRADDGYVPSYRSGMRIIFFADTSENPGGWHVFGNSDMKASMPSSEWYFYNGDYPTTTGLSVKSVNELRILSSQAPLPPTTTVAPTKTLAPTAKPTGTTTVTATATSTPGGTGIPTTAAGTTAVPATTAPPVTTLWPDNDGTVATSTTVPSDVPTNGDGSVVFTTTPTATPVTVPSATGGANVTGNATVVSSPTANATATTTVTTAPTTYERTYEYSVSPEFGYSVVEDSEPTATTATATPSVSPTPEHTTAVTAESLTPAVTTVEQTVPATPAVTTGQAARTFNRSVAFTFSVRVRESGDPALAADGALSAWLTAFLQAFAYIADIFLSP